MFLLSFPFMITFFSITYGQQPTQQNQKSDFKCDSESMDRCAVRLFGYGNRSFNFADKREAVVQQCKVQKEAEICLRQYTTRCVKPFARQYVNLMLRGPAKSLKEKCSSKRGIDEYLKNAPCMRDTKEDMDKCAEDVVHNLMLVPRFKKQEWISLACCYLSKLEKCSKKAIDGKCSSDQSEYTSRAMKHLRGDILDLFCDQELAWGSPKCKNMISKLGDRELKEKKPQSVLPVILNLMERYVSKSSPS
ncbi:uncharacterized protein LOC141851775 [Brevipalpus obovatus]|uniref:uncharacterized protein LOC141851775 n=1 Tax=Brevipalpus obovatus TaxID=246614 RepID=UPI003D9DEF93